MPPSNSAAVILNSPGSPAKLLVVAGDDAIGHWLTTGLKQGLAAASGQRTDTLSMMHPTLGAIGHVSIGGIFNRKHCSLFDAPSCQLWLRFVEKILLWRIISIVRHKVLYLLPKSRWKIVMTLYRNAILIIHNSSCCCTSIEAFIIEWSYWWRCL